MRIILILLQLITFILISPFLSGLITKLKNNLRMRKGQSILQPYHNLAKLFSKTEVISEKTSWIFKITPFVVFSSFLAAAVFVSVFIFSNQPHYLGDFLVLIFIFSLGRFFLSLSALDTGSSFGGMGASREMFISSLVEPAVCLIIFSLFLQSGSTDISGFSSIHRLTVSSIIAAAALFLLTLAETSRVPVDNQETHLELTMVHEAMVLEYSGKSLALLELAAYIKQMIWFSLIAQIIFPITLLSVVNRGEIVLWLFFYSVRIMIIAIIVALVEISAAKMRLFRVADFLGFAFVLAVIAAVCAIIGL